MLLFALLMFVLSVAMLALFERLWLDQLVARPLSHWMMEHIALPLARVFCVILFVGLAYPAVFFLKTAPPLSELLGQPGRFSDWLNALFLLGMTLPLLPGTDRVRELILPLQGALGLGMAFRWLAQAQGQAGLPWWPSASTWGFAGIWIGANLLIAAWVRRQGLEGRGQWFSETLLLLMQLPVLVVYGHQLGQSLA